MTTDPTTPTSRALEAVLLQVQDLAGAPLRVRLQWIEDAAAAVDASVAAGDLGDDGKSAALHLRAALGAIVAWSQRGSQGDKKPDSLVELDAIVSGWMRAKEVRCAWLHSFIIAFACLAVTCYWGGLAATCRARTTRVCLLVVVLLLR